ncbi:MAG: hypothetical protein V3S25_06260 [Nitrospirales bacterium]
MAKAAQAGAPAQAFTLYLDAALVAIVALLALIVLTDSIRKWYGYLVQGRPYTSTEVLGLADAQPNMVVAGGEGITLPGGRCC